MSLAPRERQALTEIESVLARSDPQLALLLERFGQSPPPAARLAGQQRLPPARLLPARLPRGSRRLVMLAVVLLALSVLWAITLSRPRGGTPAPRCGTAAMRLPRCQAPIAPFRQPQPPAGAGPAVRPRPG